MGLHILRNYAMMWVKTHVKYKWINVNMTNNHI